MKPYDTAFATAMVMAWRLPMLWAMAWDPTPARRAEAMKMILEKQMAAAEGMNAASLVAFSEWMKVLGGQRVSAEAAGQRIMRAATRPSEKRVRANAKRLSKRKRV